MAHTPNTGTKPAQRTARPAASASSLKVHKVAEVAATLRISNSMVKRLIKDRELRAFKIGSDYRISDFDFRVFLRRARGDSPQLPPRGGMLELHEGEGEPSDEEQTASVGPGGDARAAPPAGLGRPEDHDAAAFFSGHHA